ncbi:hypothetical protein Tco_0892702 [Tanacetum coccineum]|uniref:Uncharacterized protein n=1 Tax=Tanacetum coccineum TaxID=301880 RepID=A0ABQ5C6M8_9ASTR
MITRKFKDVCEPESNDSSSPTSTIVEEFDSLVGEIIKQKEEVKKISDPVARRRACFTSNLENFRIIHQGRVIHSPQIASVDKENSHSTPKESPKLEKSVDCSFFPTILKEEVHKETLKSYLNPLFKDDEEIISIEEEGVDAIFTLQIGRGLGKDKSKNHGNQAKSGQNRHENRKGREKPEMKQIIQVKAK